PLLLPLVSSRELGFSAVAYNIGGVATLVSAGIAPPLLARISAGEIELAPRALRTMLVIAGLITVALAIATPLILSVLFGDAFLDATEPAWILLAAGVALAGVE